MPGATFPPPSVGPYRLPHDAQHHVRLVGLIDRLGGERHMPDRMPLDLSDACPPGCEAHPPMPHQLQAYVEAMNDRQGTKIEIMLHGDSVG